MRPRTALAAAIAAASLARGAAANPVDAFGFGARGPAMGNAQTAAATDAGAHYYNPALLAAIDSVRIDLGYQYVDPRLTLDGRDVQVNRSRGLAVGIAVPGTVAGVRVAVGAGLFLPDEQVTRTRTLAPDQPRFVLYDNRPQRLFLGANVAVAVGDRLLVGGGLGYLSSTTGAVVLRGRLHPTIPAESDLAFAIDVDLQTVRYPQAGVLWRALPWLDLGAAFRGGFVLDVDLAFRIEGDVGPEGGPYTVEDGFLQVFTQFQDLFQPEQWAVGANARLTPRLTLAFDAVWHRWSAFENPAAHIDIDYDLKDLNDFVILPDAPPLEPPHFHDILVPHVGVEWVAARTARAVWRVRAGYTYEPSPAPEQSGRSNFVDADKHTAAAGVGVELSRVTDVLPRPMDVDLYAAYTLLEPRVARKISPVDPVGDYRAAGRLWHIGASTRWRF